MIWKTPPTMSMTEAKMVAPTAQGFHPPDRSTPLELVDTVLLPGRPARWSRVRPSYGRHATGASPRRGDCRGERPRAGDRRHPSAPWAAFAGARDARRCAGCGQEPADGIPRLSA